MATHTITTYYFTPPTLIDETVFNVLKERLKADPNFAFEPKAKFSDEFPILSWIFKSNMVTIPLGIIIILLEPRAGSFWDDVAGFCFLPLGLSFFSLLFGHQTLLSFNDFLSDKKKYYKRLRKNIIYSRNYDEFLSHYPSNRFYQF
ncbi:hypothetical protein ACSX1A_03260 [Pontibacter sp. MBLB2868]|uniref:hypothetical protein n=1 Tax=Pontibacter sp. MBLB2868 TaxID=3451555 RepID=UPI003F75691B